MRFGIENYCSPQDDLSGQDAKNIGELKLKKFVSKESGKSFSVGYEPNHFGQKETRRFRIRL